jgi:hypothetical protein
MMRYIVVAFVLVAAGLMIGSAVTAAQAPSTAVTFTKDVLPILQKNCQSCHRPGQIAPVSFLTYQTTRPWAKAMKAAVVQRTMPPWFADPQYGHFTNDRSLKPEDIDTIVKWVDGGALEGDASDAPQPVQWPADGWQIRPDLIVQGPTFSVPAHPKNDVVEWMWVTIPTGFAKDTWVTAVQIRPEHPEVAHHMCLAFKPHSPDAKYFEPVWQDKARDEEGSAIPTSGPTFGGRTNLLAGTRGLEDCYLPGMISDDYAIHNAAKLIPAGWDMMINLHYTPNGKAVTDHVQVGFTVAKEPPERQYVSLMTSPPQDPKQFAIPPNNGNWQSPSAEVTFNQDVELVFMMPHMHLRGKDMTYTLEYPNGKKETILNVPRYDFNWQLGYDTSIKIPKGTKLHVDAHFDNSVNNKFNPNPNRIVYYGEMTWEEMMTPFFGVVVDKNADPKKIITSRGPTANGA